MFAGSVGQPNPLLIHTTLFPQKATNVEPTVVGRGVILSICNRKPAKKMVRKSFLPKGKPLARERAPREAHWSSTESSGVAEMLEPSGVVFRSFELPNGTVTAADALRTHATGPPLLPALLSKMSLVNSLVLLLLASAAPALAQAQAQVIKWETANWDSRRGGENPGHVAAAVFVASGCGTNFFVSRALHLAQQVPAASGQSKEKKPQPLTLKRNRTVESDTPHAESQIISVRAHLRLHLRMPNHVKSIIPLRKRNILQKRRKCRLHTGRIQRIVDIHDHVLLLRRPARHNNARRDGPAVGALVVEVDNLVRGDPVHVERAEFGAEGERDVGVVADEEGGPAVGAAAREVHCTNGTPCRDPPRLQSGYTE
ncbi:hypothetical protein BDK51DRAFT_48423 [Blyttiomyces helicus]|uniref:Uncharacterized protein n=1 Tax=Blyttiomyces helicus TaxID=388810 RepID=A0A4P9W095_9FUNG|nr:hypothetical protein BDK51DRAFT_48423 [Blyttiomyces helicus]|eukprot:RKO85551.1 hypothetical protein BDK51DRAFT_48423 [Blyttiomyces helicus]